MRKMPVLVLLALTAWLPACGQKGPLVLPDPQHPHKKAKFPAQKAPATPAPGPESAPSSASPAATPAPAPAPAPDPAPSPAPRR